MGYDHARIKENAKTFYKVNQGNAILIYLIYIGIITGVELVGSIIPGLGNLAVMIFGVFPLTYGFVIWFKKAIYTENLPVGEIFEPFKTKFMDIVAVIGLKYLYTMLWSLLLWVPGIVKSYSYKFAEFIHHDNPNLTATQCIDISKKMTEGRKMDLFILDLSFIGWHLLGVLTGGILTILYVAPYHQAAIAFAYEEVKAESLASGKTTESELFGY